MKTKENLLLMAFSYTNNLPIYNFCLKLKLYIKSYFINIDATNGFLYVQKNLKQFRFIYFLERKKR